MEFYFLNLFITNIYNHISFGLEAAVLDNDIFATMFNPVTLLRLYLDKYSWERYKTLSSPALALVVALLFVLISVMKPDNFYHLK